MTYEATLHPIPAPTTGRLFLLSGVVAILCLAPLGMMAAGISLSSARPALSPEWVAGLPADELGEAAHWALRGSYTHTILEWTSVCIALVVCTLAFIQYRLMRDPSLLIIGVALACAGVMDAFHTFAAARLIHAVADNKDLIPFTWAICRLFNGVIQLIGVGIFVLWINKTTKISVLWTTATILGFVVSAYLIVHYCATSARLPQTMFPEMMISRPYDLYPLAPFLLCGLIIFPLYYRRNPSLFGAALILSIIPQVATQLYMAFGSTALHDSAFNVAHTLKAVSYLFPAGGLLAVNVNAFKQNRLTDIALRKNQKMMEEVLSELKDQKLVIDKHAIISIADIKGNITYTNEKFCQISGYSAEELIGKNHRVVKSNEHDRTFYRDLWTTISKGDTWRGEIKNLTKQGTHYWVDATIVPFKDDLGRVTQYVAIRTDITEMKNSRQRLDLALVAANQGLWDWNLTDNSTYFNDTWYTMLGYEPGQLPMNLETWKRLCHPEDLPLALAEVDKHLKGETDIYRCEQRVRMNDGSWKWIMDVGKVTERDTEGEPLRMIGVHMDIDHSKDSELSIKESELRYKLAVNGSRDGLWDWDLLTDKVYYAPQWRRMLGLGPDDPVSDSPEVWITRIDQRDIGAFMQEFDEHLRGEDETFEVELRMNHASGQTVWMLCRGAVVRNEAGRAVRVAGSMADITAIKEAQDMLRKAAEHDRLTDLPNRELFATHLNQAIEHARVDPNFKFAVLFFDFDRFKVINDSLGHNVGDALLIDIARQFDDILRHGDIAARFGGDEFVVLLNNLADYNEARLTASRLLDTFARPHDLMGHEVISTASIGLVTNAQRYTRADAMLRDADAAMYQAKEAGKARVVIFDQTMHAQALERLELEADLRGSMERKEFQVHYQPIVHLEDGALHGFEALLRWYHPTRGLISPAEFIPIAEDTGLIVPIGEWVLREACRQLYQWNHHTRPDHPVNVNVNLSMRQVCHPDVLATVRDAINDSGIDPKYLKLEVTESTIIDDRHDMTPLLNQIKELGISLAMDDFGTGHSSLSNLHKLPVDVLKIDQSFIRSMIATRELAAVMQAIITVAQHFDMTTVAEGIETPEQLALLQSLECDYGQGYYFKKPMPADAATRYLLGQDDAEAA